MTFDAVSYDVKMVPIKIPGGRRARTGDVQLDKTRSRTLTLSQSKTIKYIYIFFSKTLDSLFPYFVRLHRLLKMNGELAKIGERSNTV